MAITKKKATATSKNKEASKTKTVKKEVEKPSKVKPTATKAEPAKKNRAAGKPKSKTGSYTQSEFIENIQSFCGLNKKSQAKELCEDINLLLVDCLKKGYRIPLFNLGKLQVKKTKARMGINPMTKEKIKIPAKRKVRFTAAKALKEAVI
jgi:DNA-binding protein HU-beta